MISSDFSIRQFIEAIKEMDHWEIIYLADKEATEAWRNSYGDKSASAGKSKTYQAQLIRLIRCLKSGVQLPRVSDPEDRLLNLICCDKRSMHGPTSNCSI
jgi:hypothetical protein